MAKKKQDKKENDDIFETRINSSKLTWCYIGNNQEYVMMTCTREDWEKIRIALESARRFLDKEYRLAHESDEFNYGYTYSDWRHSNEK